MGWVMFYVVAGVINASIALTDGYPTWLRVGSAVCAVGAVPSAVVMWRARRNPSR